MYSTLPAACNDPPPFKHQEILQSKRHIYHGQLLKFRGISLPNPSPRIDAYPIDLDMETGHD